MAETKHNNPSVKKHYIDHNAEQPSVNNLKKDKIKKNKKVERKKALKAFPMLTYKHTLYHPFSLDSLIEFVKRRPKDVSVSTIMELFIQKTTSPQYLHLIRKRISRRHLNGGMAEEIHDDEVKFAKFILAEQYKDKHGISMEEEKNKKIIRKRRPRVDPKTGIIIKEKKVCKRKKREKRTPLTPDYRNVHVDKIVAVSQFSALKEFNKR